MPQDVEIKRRCHDDTRLHFWPLVILKS